MLTPARSSNARQEFPSTALAGKWVFLLLWVFFLNLEGAGGRGHPAEDDSVVQSSEGFCSFLVQTPFDELLL